MNIVDTHDSSISTDNGHVLRLLRSLYGLKQSPQLWNQELHRFFESCNHKRADAETCLYYKRNPQTGTFVIVLSEVDDLVVTGNDQKMIMEFHESLIAAFASKNDDGSVNRESIAWEPISSFLGIDILYDRTKGILTMNVKAKIDKLFDDHHPHLSRIGTLGTPVTSDFAHDGFEEDVELTPMEAYLKQHYASIVGSMIYIMTTCRPDIAFVTGKLARGMHQPTRMHVNLLKGALKYLNCHRSTPLVYKRRNTEANKHFQRMQYEDGSCFCVGGSTYDPVSVMDMSDDSEIKDVIAGFTDADFAKSHAEQRRSTSGYAFFVYGNLVSWKSKLQPLTAGSTHEAELISLSFAADEGVWLRRLLTEIRFATIPGEPSYVYYESHDKHGKVVKSAKEHLKSLPATPIFEDNMGTWHTVNNPTSTAQASRHLDVRYFKVRDHISDGKLRVHFLRTDLNVSDFFTKGLPSPAFRSFMQILMGTVSSNY